MTIEVRLLQQLVKENGDLDSRRNSGNRKKYGMLWNYGRQTWGIVKGWELGMIPLLLASQSGGTQMGNTTEEINCDGSGEESRNQEFQYDNIKYE